jgi:peptidoglycan-associated lipoprotein
MFLIIEGKRECAMMKFNRSLFLPISLILLAGCAGQSGTSQDSGGSGSSGGASTSGAGDDGYRQGSEFDDGGSANLLDSRIIYFGFDQSDVDSEGMEILAAHARNIASNSNVKIRLEGHADERGSREYNIGLGERRAQAVRQVLLLRGVGSAQMTTVSYGEERPASSRSDEKSWAKNRRVELVYLD